MRCIGVTAKRLRAFSLTELLIAIVITAILGGVVVTALWLLMGSFFQNEDYTAGRLEIEEAFQFLTPQITNAGLGMPNNRAEQGSFSAAFTGGGSAQNIMHQMGDPARDDRSWGGPITVAKDPDGYTNAGKTVSTVDDNGVQVFVGPVLYYAWAVPTGIRIRPSFDVAPRRHGLVSTYPPASFPHIDATSMDSMFWSSEHSESDPRPLTLRTLRGGDVNRLQGFRYDGREIGIQASGSEKGSNVRSWIILPTLRVPLLVSSINNTADTLQAQVAPYSFNDHGITGGAIKNVLLGGLMWGYEEIHLVQAASLFVNSDHDLVQRVFMGNTADGSLRREKILARNIAAVCFRFDPEARLVTMYVAARGTEPMRAQPAIPAKWPSNIAPVASYFSAGDRHYRIQVESMTWRIRN